jgi:hypothetical protein
MTIKSSLLHWEKVLSVGMVSPFGKMEDCEMEGICLLKGR